MIAALGEVKGEKTFHYRKDIFPKRIVLAASTWYLYVLLSMTIVSTLSFYRPIVILKEIYTDYVVYKYRMTTITS